MRLNQSLIENHLWETFNIDFHKEIREKINKTSENEKEAINKNLILLNYFLLRRTRDPGFYAYVLDEINCDAKIQKRVKKYIYSLISTTLKDELFNSNSQNIAEQAISSGELINNIASFSINPVEANKRAIEYFSKRLRNAEHAGDEEEVIVISQLLMEYKTGGYFGSQLFNESFYKDAAYTHKWEYSIRKYILESIRFYDLYEPPFRYQYLLFDLIYPDRTFIESVTSILDEVGEDPHLPFELHLLKHNKFIKDFISIASVLWFDAKAEHEKLEILNNLYPFTITDKNLEPFLKFGFGNDFLILNNFAAELSRNNYLDEAKIILFFLLDKNRDNDVSYVICDNLASAFREQEMYEKALEYYEKAYNFAINSEYKKYIELKNIGEMLYQLGNIEEAKIYISKINANLENLS